MKKKEIKKSKNWQLAQINLDNSLTEFNMVISRTNLYKELLKKVATKENKNIVIKV